jgi:hypothetical protein
VSQSQRAIHGHVPCNNFDYSILIFDFFGVSGGVVHGRGFETLSFGVNGGVVHGRGIESMTYLGSMVV